MKKQILFILLTAIYVNCFSQKKSVIDTLDISKFTIQEYKDNYVKKPTVNVLVLEDNTILKKGSELVIGTPSNPNNKNYHIYYGEKTGETTVDFSHILVGKLNLFNNFVIPVLFSNKDKGDVILIDKIMLTKTRKLYHIHVNFTKKDGTNVALTKYGHVLDFLKAIKNGEIINPNRAMSRKEAIAKLKESKDLLELEMISKEEFNKIKKELTPLIMQK